MGAEGLERELIDLYLPLQFDQTHETQLARRILLLGILRVLCLISTEDGGDILERFFWGRSKPSKKVKENKG
jgi:hypothetical protein